MKTAAALYVAATAVIAGAVAERLTATGAPTTAVWVVTAVIVGLSGLGGYVLAAATYQVRGRSS